MVMSALFVMERDPKLLIGGGYSAYAAANIYNLTIYRSVILIQLWKEYSGGYAAEYGESKINGNVVAEYKNMTIDTLVGAGGYIENDGSGFVDIEGNSTLVFSKIVCTDLLSGGICAEAGGQATQVHILSWKVKMKLQVHLLVVIFL